MSEPKVGLSTGAKVGAVALVALVAGLFVDNEQFFRSYLFAFLFWLGLGLGSFAIVMLHNQASGDGVIAGVTYRAPLLQYGTVPLTVPLGESRAVRMRREVGTPIRPEKLQFFVFARLSPAS